MDWTHIVTALLATVGGAPIGAYALKLYNDYKGWARCDAVGLADEYRKGLHDGFQQNEKFRQETLADMKALRTEVEAFTSERDKLKDRCTKLLVETIQAKLECQQCRIRQKDTAS